jgi:hypothetical protein
MVFSYSRIQAALFKKFSKESIMFDWFRELRAYIMMRYHPLEDRLINTFRYVECNPANINVFSYEYASILRDTGSVFSSAMDRLLSQTQYPRGGKKSTYNIVDYCNWLTENVEKIEQVTLGLNYPIEHKYLQPLKGISDTTKKMEWWIAYNCVKHHDMKKSFKGNLGNALNGVAALAVLYASSVSRGIRLFEEIGFFEPQAFVEKSMFC